nr:hypothetical protein [uncultured Brevundimonas sp.]
MLLFDDTLRANIAYGRPDASDEEIRAVARLAGAADFIEALPQGYDTPRRAPGRDPERRPASTHRDCPGDAEGRADPAA